MEDSYLSLDNDDPNLTCNDLNEGRVALKLKNDHTRRSWSPREEEVLLSALKGLVVTGWKADNGFRGGYHRRILEVMKREFPRTDLKITPHITSKISQWKKNYSSLCGILGRSGIGFNLNNTTRLTVTTTNGNKSLRRITMPASCVSSRGLCGMHGRKSLEKIVL
ncbi:hypothetical protein AAHA92_00388 [Salvia divinorum]|uniref:Myb/SANT-like domain-containing protein n=1 Tax=Salvia divinorum TaxID=28513 RepID=A0ABD1IM69_SALDI